MFLALYLGSMQFGWTADKLGTGHYVYLVSHYHLPNRAEFERKLVDVCLAYGLGKILYLPLSGIFLDGKYILDQTLVVSPRYVSRYYTKLRSNRSAPGSDLMIEDHFCGLPSRARSSSTIEASSFLKSGSGWLRGSPGLSLLGCHIPEAESGK